MADTALEPPFYAYAGSEAFIFVSYAHKDATIVFPELNRLHKLGYRIWFDEGIDPGNEWRESIAKALKRASMFLVFISPSAVASRNVNSEINRALDLNKDILAVYLTETELPDGLALGISSIQAVKKYRMEERSYRRKMEIALSVTLRNDSSLPTPQNPKSPTTSGLSRGSSPILSEDLARPDPALGFGRGSRGATVSGPILSLFDQTRAAAEQGHADAQFSLGGWYRDGTGVTKDTAEAVKWFRKAAEQGYALAQTSLGACYQNGTGVVKDDAEAVRWYRKATEQGEVYAQNNLGVCYRDGIGVTKDISQAEMWLRKAADKGLAVAVENLGRLAAPSMPVTTLKSQPGKMYSSAASAPTFAGRLKRGPQGMSRQ